MEKPTEISSNTPSGWMTTIGAIALVIAAVPARAQDATEGPATPDAYAEESTSTDTTTEPAADIAVSRESLKPLWIAGIISWSAVYLAGMITTAAIAEDSVKSKAVGYMAIPLMGPFIFLGHETEEVLDGYQAPIIVSGVLQIVTVGMIVAGLLIKRDVKTEPLSFGSDRPGAPRMSLLPAAMGQGGAGAVFTLTHF